VRRGIRARYGRQSGKDAWIVQALPAAREQECQVILQQNGAIDLMSP
jgi:hypothetical protein